MRAALRALDRKPLRRGFCVPIDVAQGFPSLDTSKTPRIRDIKKPHLRDRVSHISSSPALPSLATITVLTAAHQAIPTATPAVAEAGAALAEARANGGNHARDASGEDLDAPWSVAVAVAVAAGADVVGHAGLVGGVGFRVRGVVHFGGLSLFSPGSSGFGNLGESLCRGGQGALALVEGKVFCVVVL
jgi:hypothetical protein